MFRYLILLVCMGFSVPLLAQSGKKGQAIEAESPTYSSLNIDAVAIKLLVGDAELQDPVNVAVAIYQVSDSGETLMTMVNCPNGVLSTRLPINRNYRTQISAPRYYDTTFVLNLTQIDKYDKTLQIPLRPDKLDLEVRMMDLDSDKYVVLEGVMRNFNRDENIWLYPEDAIDGSYFIKVREDDEYELEVKGSEGYVFYTDNRIVPKRGGENKMEVKVIKTLRPNTKIPLYNVNFSFGSSQLNEQSISELDRVLVLLEKYPNAHLKVTAHTDSVGSKEKNMALSQQRADNVRDYLVSGGFPKEQMISQGYGSSQPIASNTSPEGRAINRRFEIIIISI